jgi:hypothetical protein
MSTIIDVHLRHEMTNIATNVTTTKIGGKIEFIRSLGDISTKRDIEMLPRLRINVFRSEQLSRAFLKRQ